MKDDFVVNLLEILVLTILKLRMTYDMKCPLELPLTLQLKHSSLAHERQVSQ